MFLKNKKLRRQVPSKFLKNKKLRRPGRLAFKKLKVSYPQNRAVFFLEVKQIRLLVMTGIFRFDLLGELLWSRAVRFEGIEFEFCGR